MSPGQRFDVVIIGGGIAGASLAYFLTRRGVTDVVLLEQESQPGFHATGRSAASVVEWDPVPALQELKVQGAAFLRDPPADFSEHSLIKATGILVTCQEPLWSAARAAAATSADRGTVVRILSPAECVDLVPVLSPAYVDGGVLLPEDGRIDVHQLLWSYLRHAMHAGVHCRWGVTVEGIRVEGGRSRAVVTSSGELETTWIVNAAGAWAAGVGMLAQATPVPLTPHRRTIVTFAAPEDVAVRDWPLVHNESQRLYFAPESGGLLACPMDEEPMEPCNAQPSELVVAQAIERLGRVAPRLVPQTLRRTWAGLRTFVPDRALVVG